MKGKLAKEVADDDRVPTFYFAEVDGKKKRLRSCLQRKTLLTVYMAGVAVAPSGKVKSIKIFDPDKSLAGSGDF
jgi:hypothetical protein